MIAAIEKMESHEGRLCVAGKFSPDSLRKEAEEMPGWDRAILYPWLSRAELAALLGNVRGGLVLFHPEANHLAAQPNKIFEYMSAGLPVIASNFPLWKEIIEGNRCGLCVDPLDPGAISAAMDWVLANPTEAMAMGARGRRAVEETYNWPREAQKLVAFYRALLAEK
jgi:glycosyltransferase involved in cell wall biosynthesis